MSNPTELPVTTWEDRAYAELGHLYPRYDATAYMQAEIDELRAVIARRTQPDGEASALRCDPSVGFFVCRERAECAQCKPEGEAPQAVRECAECHGAGGKQVGHGLLGPEWKECNACDGIGILAAPTATLSPLCGAQHAESGKEAYQVFSHDSGEWYGVDKAQYDRAHDSCRRILAAQLDGGQEGSGS